MTRRHSLARVLAAALAISALAAPAAGARPADVGAHGVTQSPPNARGTDVRAPDQQAPAGSQDLRSPDTADAGRPVNQPPIRRAAVDGDDGSPWPTIGLALVGACVALAGTAVVAGRIRRRTGGATA
jgi:hypothetical protein